MIIVFVIIFLMQYLNKNKGEAKSMPKKDEEEVKTEVKKTEMLKDSLI